MKLERLLKTYQESEVIFRENSRGKDMYFIQSGKANLYKQWAPEENILLATLEPGCLFGTSG